MHKTKHRPFQSPFQQANLSSSSLEGMERPVKSFKSFVKTVPPHPTFSKPLPPVPPRHDSSSERERHSSHSTPTSQSPNTWEAPVEWLDPRIPVASAPTSEFDELPRLYPPRTYSPILPEVSPEMVDTFIEFPLPQMRKGSATSQKRLSPVPESRYSALNAPQIPPRSLSPKPPAPNAITKSSQLPIYPEVIEVPISTLIRPSTDEGYMDTPQSPPRASPIPSSMAQSSSAKMTPPRSYSPIKGLTVMGAYAGDEPPPRAQKEPLPSQGDHGAAQGDMNDEDWEDENLYDAYHHVLIDQYRDMAISDDKHKNSRVLEEHEENGQDHTLLPRPLSWQKNSSASASRRESPYKQPAVREQEAEETQQLRRGSGIRNAFKKPRIGSFANMPKRAGVELNPAFITPQLQHETIIRATDSQMSVKKKGNKLVDPKYRFSAFYPRAKPLNSARVPKLKPSKKNKGKQKEDSSAHLRPPHPHMAISSSRTASPTAQTPTSEPASIHTPSHPPSPTHLASLARSQRQRTESGSLYSNTGAHSSNSDSCLPISYTQKYTPRARQMSLATFLTSTPPPPTPAPTPNTSTSPDPRSRSRSISGVFEKFKARSSFGSPQSHSPHSNGSSYPPPLRFLASSERSSQTASSQDNYRNSSSEPSDWRKAHPDDDEAGEKKIGLFEKALEARRKRVKEGRQEKLKKSIRVLGPTDPKAVAGNGEEKRKPGYLGLPIGK